MTPIVLLQQNINTGYVPSSLEIAEEMAKLQTLQALRTAILQHRALLNRPPSPAA